MNTNDCATITWIINNIIYCWQKKDEAIVSPKFCIYMPEETKWKLILFPLGVCSIDGMSLFLYRDEDCKGPEIIKVEYYLSILIPGDNSMIGYPKTYEFRKGKLNGLGSYTDEVRKAEGFMQEGSLIIRCKIIQIDGNLVKMPQIFARTIIGVETFSFQWPLENFSNFVREQKQSLVVISKSKEVLMQINLVLTSDNEDNICFGIDSSDLSMKFFAVKIFIKDSQEKQINSGEYECWFESEMCEMFPLTLSKARLMENKNLYLPNNVLTLSFELTISNGFAYEGIEKAVYQCHPFLKEVIKTRQKCITHQKMTDCTCALVADLTSVQKDQSTCDMKLQTKTCEFPVHTFILRARSPVFKAMFLHEMKEKLNGCVDVSDLDDETVRQFLLYLYSDQLGDLHWDDALQLYMAADKYVMVSLRDKCSMFLRRNLNQWNACEALILSDLHQDKALKEMAQNFILKNAKVIFKSEEWKNLTQTKSKLALETTLRNWNED